MSLSKNLGGLEIDPRIQGDMLIWGVHHPQADRLASRDPKYNFQKVRLDPTLDRLHQGVFSQKALSEGASGTVDPHFEYTSQSRIVVVFSLETR